MKIFIYLVFLSLVISAQEQRPSLGPEVWVIRAYYPDRATVDRLVAERAPWAFNLKEGFVILEADEAEMERLARMGFVVEVDQQHSDYYRRPVEKNAAQGGGIPGFPCYPTVEETFTLMDNLVGLHPDLVEIIDIGDSWEKLQDPDLGHDLLVLRLTNRLKPGPKPTLFIMSSVHAREYTPAGLNTRFAQQLLNGYDQDADMTWLLDDHEILLLLQANPDGRKHAETGIFWRKNTNNDFCSNSNLRGIDLNRNFAFMWGCCNGSSTSPCSEVFRGPSAASEPEIQAVQDYVRSIFPDQRDDDLLDAAPEDATGVFMDIHSSGGLVIWPFGFTAQTAANGLALQTMGRKLAFFNDYSPLAINQFTIADGSTVDFAYGELGVASYGYELGTTFFESCDNFENQILPQNLPSLMFAAKLARTPYLTAAGPDILDPTVSAATLDGLNQATLHAVADDTRFNQTNGVEPSQNIAAAEYYWDVPPWGPGNPVAVPMNAADGAFDENREDVEAQLDLAGLSIGRHMVFLRSRDDSDHWGPVSAVFVEVTSPAVLLQNWPDGIDILDLIPVFALPSPLQNTRLIVH